MLDIKLDNNHDISIPNIDLLLISDAEQVKQQLIIKLRLWTGEWFLDTAFGTPYMQSILGKQLTLSGAIAALRKSILEVSGVQSIQDFTYDFNNSTRLLKISFSANTDFGLIEVTA